MEPVAEFLTPEECAEVDKALLTSHDKFTTRVAIYALRSLKQIAQVYQVPLEQVEPGQIEDWIYQDGSLQNNLDRDFKPFFSRLVIASLTPLKAAAQTMGQPLETLTVPQLIAWFEQQAKHRLEAQSATPPQGQN